MKNDMTLKLAPLFCDHMVLQRGIRVPVWGLAKRGARVTVSFAGQSQSTNADKSGRWKIFLKPMKASCESRELMVVAHKASVLVCDVVVGDVWLCSGQSNMEWPVEAVTGAEQEIMTADYPNIRLLSVPKSAHLNPSAELDVKWGQCNAESAVSFSAAGYFFGRTIQRATGIPVGLINASWGGTYIETWMPRESLESVPFMKHIIGEYLQSLECPESLAMKHRQAMDTWAAQHDRKDTVNDGEIQGWHQLATSDTTWETMDLPRSWQSAGHEHSGVFWFRREVEIPAEWAGCDLTLSLGPTDKSDVTYFNGVKIGSLTMEERSDAWCTPRVYTIPGKLVTAGRALIAVRIFSNIYYGGFIGNPHQLKICRGDDAETAIPLAGSWRYRIEANFGFVTRPPLQPSGPGNPNSPWMLFDNMIRPLIPYAIRGVIWYQGESNAGASREYRTLFPLMIKSWRNSWKQGATTRSTARNFPFLFVQLANFMKPQEQPGESSWAELREAQTMTLKTPNTAMAVAIDIGDANDIHPKNKQDVGYRLALPALKFVHGFKELVTSGPVYKGMRIEKGRIRITFDHTAGGLVAKGGILKGFAIAGKNSTFVWAEAVIAGQTVVVSSPKVARPVAVRYGWADNPACNLYNASGLPASPFRTDVAG